MLEWIRVIAPSEIKHEWPTLSPRFFVETSGPARAVTSEERLRIYQELGLPLSDNS